MYIDETTIKREKWVCEFIQRRNRTEEGDQEQQSGPKRRRKSIDKNGKLNKETGQAE